MDRGMDRWMNGQILMYTIDGYTCTCTCNVGELKNPGWTFDGWINGSLTNSKGMDTQLTGYMDTLVASSNKAV